MELKHIDIAHLSVSPANMRAKGKTPDLTNILPSVRARGVLVPLIVRQNGSPDSYEIVAGKRRYHAALTIAQESGEAEALPCAIMAAGDDAAALEASLIENVARLDPDEVTRWESFTRLVREGRNVEDIALTFGLTELQVKRTLALGNLLPRIRTLYRQNEIDAATVRHLTLLSKARQRDWLALLDDPAAYCPTRCPVESVGLRWCIHPGQRRPVRSGRPSGQHRLRSVRRRALLCRCVHVLDLTGSSHCRTCRRLS